ncbi:MAG: 50S ribosomal protein L23 [Candidatus Brockarchaeota archaeon]|nr:50S ribosomal protein L23 [Candidatus Brockarchaeota archaeon]MBO3808101.1 50S ribosomal protein L23 [Candidatus Brockarchaeota archaeon]
MSQSSIIIRPVSTEKSFRLIEKENKLIFIVNPKADKNTVREAVEKSFNVKVEKINIIRSITGEKKAVVKLAKEYSAMDLASKLKIV